MILVHPLQGQRHLHRLVVVVAERHEHGRTVETDNAGEEAGECSTDAQQQQGQQCQRLLADDKQHEDNGEGHEPRYFTQALQGADLQTGKRRLLHGEVIDQGLPCGKA